MRKSVRNDINRKVNAELANQAKSAEAAIDQIVSIRKLAESGKVADLPPGLQEFVRLRLALSRCELERARRAGESAPFEVGGVSSRSSSRGHRPRNLCAPLFALRVDSPMFGRGGSFRYAAAVRPFRTGGSPIRFTPFVLEILSRCLHLMIESCAFTLFHHARSNRNG